MPRPKSNIEKVKCTIYLHPEYYKKLKVFIEQEKLTTISDGVIAIIENYFSYLKKCADEELMKKAAKDDEFIKRSTVLFSELMDDADG